MFKFSGKSLPVALGLIGFATVATAADLDPPVQDPVEEYSYGGWYVRGDMGAAIAEVEDPTSSEEGFAIGGGLGYTFSDMFRADVTYDAALEFDFGAALGDSVNAHSVMGNLYFDLPFTIVFRPYLGAGVGWGFVDGGAFDDDGVAVAGMTGLTYDMPNNGTLDLGYRLRYIDIDTAATDHWIDHSIRIGLRFGF